MGRDLLAGIETGTDLLASEPQGTLSKTPPWYETYPTSATERFMGGIGKGFVDVGRGVGQRLGLYTPEQIKKWREEDVSLMKDNTAGEVGEFAGRALPFATVPGGVAGGTLARMGTSALAGGAMGYLEPTTPEESVAGNVAKGAVAGGTMSGVLSAGGKLVNAVKEPVGGAIQGLSDKFGIKTTLGEVTQIPLVKKMESWLEEVPIIGLRKYRQKQQEQAEVAAKDFIGKFIHDPSASNIMESNRAYSRSLYEDMKQLLPGVDQQNIVPSETKKIASELVERYPDIFKQFQDKRTEGLIRSIVKDTEGGVKGKGPIITGGEIIKPPGIKYNVTGGEPLPNTPGVTGAISTGRTPYKIDITGSNITKVNPVKYTPGTGKSSVTTSELLSGTMSKSKELTFDEAWNLRQGLGEIIGMARKKLASQSGDVSETQLSQMKALFKAVSTDMESWSDKIGRSDIKEAFNVANEGYKQFVVRYDKLQRVYDKAIVKVGDQEFLSPQRLAGSLKRDIIDKDKYVKKFTTKQIEEMAGMENIMRIVHRAGQFKENPPTGLRWSLPIFGGTTVGAGALAGATGVGAIGGGVALTGIAKFLTSTEAGKRLVLSASKVEPQSPAFLRIVNEVYNQLPKLASREATNPE